MFGKGLFVGDYRSKPKVSIRGATRTENRDQLLQRAHHDRAQREAKRNELNAAILIQAAVRGFITRRRLVRRILGEDIPRIKQILSKSDPPDINALKNLVSLLVIAKDYTNLIFVCQIFVKHRQIFVPLVKSDVSWQFSLCRLALMSLTHLRDGSQTSDQAGSTSMAPCLRFLETFTSYNESSTTNNNDRLTETGAKLHLLSRLYSFMVRHGYFAAVRQLIDSRVPPLIEATVRAPTPLAAEILQMVWRPLLIAQVTQDSQLSRDIVQAFASNILCPPFTEQVELFILPNLALSKPSSPTFPLGLLLRHLSPVQFSSKQLTIPETPHLLYSLLTISHQSVQHLDPADQEALLKILNILIRTSIVIQRDEGHDDIDSDDETMDVSQDDLAEKCIQLLNSQELVTWLVKMAERRTDVSSKGPSPTKASSMPKMGSFSFGSGSGGVSAVASMSRQSDSEVIRHVCSICHHLLMYNKQAMHTYTLLYSLAFRPNFLRKLWQLAVNTCQPSILGSPTPLISIIMRGLKMSSVERDEIVPLLAVFCALFRYLLVTIHDTEFYSRGDMSASAVGGGSSAAADSLLEQVAAGQDRGYSAASPNWMPFSLSELVPMCLSLRDISLGLIELAFPESRPSVREDYKFAVNSVRNNIEDECTGDDVAIWSNLFKTLVSLVQLLYSRDTRRQFCPNNHWINGRLSLPVDRPQEISFSRSRIRAYRPFLGLRMFTREELEEGGPPLSTKEVRLATVLREMPFSIAFNQRVILFQNLIQRDKQEHQQDSVNFQLGPTINVSVRRDYIYEDAFDKLSPENAPNMRMKMRVQLVNVAGLDEAGIDGGGLFREFLSQLLKSAFDPNRGFFVLTRDQHLYPNPAVNHVHQNTNKHYYFMGRMLGKALYENLLVELPLASFFLSKMLGQRMANVDIDHLDSLDAELYKNLLYLKTYDGDVQDLGLDFTIVVEEFGETRIELLKPDGDNILVTSENRIEYIHLVADYKLNRQIRAQCNAFRSGLEDVIGLDWLRMFSHRELQTLISGAEHDINVDDLQNHTNYSGGFGVDHPTIVAFWKVVIGMSKDQKRALLKFVTSCSRPPLLGFRDLDPPFCIQNAGSESNRLPTASTCMNLLKLPAFQDADVLEKKLLYAIESGAGFELS